MEVEVIFNSLFRHVLYKWDSCLVDPTQQAEIKPFTVSRNIETEAGNQNWKQQILVFVKIEINVLVVNVVLDNKEVF